jgi:hypothetical protein
MSIPRRINAVVSPAEARELYSWVDSVNLSRQRRNVARDFADGVLVAELISQHHPQIVEIHNYSSASSFPQKMHNWNTLNTKVLKRLGLGLHPKDMEDCANMAPGAIEKVLKRVMKRMLNGQISDSDTDVSRISSGKDIRMLQSTRSLKTDPLEELRNQLEGQQKRIRELEATVEVLTLKNSKLEQLLEIKDKKIEALKHATA